MNKHDFVLKSLHSGWYMKTFSYDKDCEKYSQEAGKNSHPGAQKEEASKSSESWSSSGLNEPCDSIG